MIIVRRTEERDVEPSRALMRAVFDEHHVALVDSLRLARDVIVDCVACLDDRIVGHLVCSRMQSPSACLGLGPIGVAPNEQRRGVGSELIKRTISEARSGGWRAIFVLGATGYYERFGFSTQMAAKFETVYPKEHFMVLELVPGACEMLATTAIYPRAFVDAGV